MNDSQKYRSNLLTIILISALTLIPFIGLTDFNTKGEPREAIVAVTMIDTHNWILPQNNGDEFAYKPPMFHWFVAATSVVIGGVNEFSARFPSALAGVVLAVMTFCFFARRKNQHIALLTSVIMLTTFEVHRAATNCRVDMMLTLFIVLALYQLFRWTERDLRGIPIWAILWMSCGMLTKGPVAIILPCLVSCVYLWIQGRHFWFVVWRFALIAMSAMILPCLWYYAAWLQGGDKFLYLIYEENVLRFLGKMPYSSHENGAWYYPVVLLSSAVPYTLICLMALFTIQREQWRKLQVLKSAWWKGLWEHIRKMDRVELFSLLAIVLIIGFYTIPKSKRGVYILPVYPFVAYFVARLIEYLSAVRPRIVIFFGWVLATIVGIVFIGMIIIKSGFIPDSIFHGRHATENIAMLHALADNSIMSSTNSIFLIVCAIAIYLYYSLSPLGRLIQNVAYNALLIFLLLDALLLPPLMSSRSDKPLAAEVENYTKQKSLYSFVDDKDKMLHFFTLNFYCHNRIQIFNPEVHSGLLLIGDRDVATFSRLNPNIQLEPIRDFHHRSCDTRQNILLYEFQTKNMKQD
jgi:dolichyl-phosphate-mannose-protein mannosyltransferase